jgi:hypothetical protein
MASFGWQARFKARDGTGKLFCCKSQMRCYIAFCKQKETFMSHALPSNLSRLSARERALLALGCKLILISGKSNGPAEGPETDLNEREINR